MIAAMALRALYDYRIIAFELLIECRPMPDSTQLRYNPRSPLAPQETLP